jgi:hypothetical protein
MGRLLTEEKIKRLLTELNKDIFFDYASTHNENYPNQDYHQGVYYGGWPEGRQYVCQMDRGGPLNGMLAEVPVWTAVQDMVRVHWNDVTTQELNDHTFGSIMPCFDDENYVMVKRWVKGDPVLCGWRSTFLTLARAKIPNVTIGTLESKFQISLQETPEEAKLFDEGKPPWLNDNDPDFVDEEAVLEEMGAFDKKPTSGPWEGTK